MPTKKPTLRDLVYLTFASNPCYVHVLGKRPENVKINLEDETWTCGGYTQKIGQAKPLPSEHGYYNPMIGVYNRKDISHLTHMVREVAEITRRQSRGAVDMD